MCIRKKKLLKCVLLFSQEINILLSGQLTEEDEAAVDEELANILAEDMPEVPTQEPEVEPVKGKCLITENM